MKISSENKKENQKLIRNFIEEYKAKNKKMPTISEMCDYFNMGETAIKRYKKSILEENKKIIRDVFPDRLVEEVQDLLKIIQENKIIFRDIRDGGENDSIKMDAAKHLQELVLDTISLLRNGSELLGLDYVKSEKVIDKSNITKEEQDKIESGINNMFNS